MTANQAPVVWVDGVRDKRLSPLNRGLAYGDGLFETCRLESGCIALWPWHRARMIDGLARLGIELSGSTLESLVQSALDDTSGSGILKVIVTRQDGGRGYRASGICGACTVIIHYPASIPPPSSYRVRLCHTPIAQNPATAGLKHLCRLENVIARSEWSDDTIHEGLLLTQAGEVVEATAHNIFIAHSNVLITPDLSESGVCGVMRQVILNEVAPKIGIPTRVAPLTQAEMICASEIFLCNSNVGIVPVVDVLNSEGGSLQQYVSGPVVQNLQAALEQFLASQQLLSPMRRC
ncbi:aminodeoxychorismate lyase [Gilvimarinus agarilyticus]|uniref:aminodeoxychorismate lyase n=1 Tax=Gilvimarinus sp. 2_MG-2023 TaxID=3062666 RepID=UPI001C07F9D5|nr:aminodeoxychorismate lyase [Gilvimarinus sp. 2_MG-2023]MBU2887049.1 aminodeoxychorismate lyase [Gilvimarinus agarilyticus]MDO6571709.1 aminodeoxychorismate lyase [Gilvimarinus sp. 2_MG-2023]